ncbi:MAG TPA: PTS sugar transporter subunit IIA [Companilactobacillus farciminis]|jgi:PTS system mannose-specific IIA component|uniref:PTS sugar transporter subunit IIA n=3 Tax=Companilactobacillus TaxID=2767879 RepID=A0A921HPE2_9LACO|nr:MULTISPECIES: PTS sugar transporter subunit IIA [Companilactobacillus]KRK95495.1 phosphotransferase system, mannose fructose-specific component IIA [Companilactobacillus futsaii JCM 17355]QCX25612.1 PTS sugar transporter subunit IIA [Companilactobacillus futsaii]WCG35347.1 PTS sugar transporter subunit IIA [Companilactobacillus farciminis]HJF86257.1 PTS sugar transporter subunit IIA [Companilactobacillus farciminis]
MALILMSHGNMAIETLKSAELIIGELPETVALGLQKSDGPETLKAKVETEIKKYYGKEPVFLIVDLLGGTPGNVAVNLTQDYPEMHVISGLNLPMVINYANQKFIGQDIKVNDIMKEGKDGIVDVNAFINAESDEDDEDE